MSIRCSRHASYQLHLLPITFDHVYFPVKIFLSLLLHFPFSSFFLHLFLLPRELCYFLPFEITLWRERFRLFTRAELQSCQTHDYLKFDRRNPKLVAFLRTTAVILRERMLLFLNRWVVLEVVRLWVWLASRSGNGQGDVLSNPTSKGEGMLKSNSSIFDNELSCFPPLERHGRPVGNHLHLPNSLHSSPLPFLSFACYPKGTEAREGERATSVSIISTLVINDYSDVRAGR